MDKALSQKHVEAVTALGDDALILGQRLGEWCGHAPTLELDLSLANLGLDLIGQAQFFLGYAGELGGQGHDADALAYRRDVYSFRNCLLVEQPNGDFGQTIARQFLFSTWQKLLFEEMVSLSDPRLTAIAEKAVKEIGYHARFAADWVVRLGDGTAESRQRMIAGLAWCWRFVDELFDPADADLVAARLVVNPAILREVWNEKVQSVLDDAGLDRPAAGRGITGGRRGRHSEHLGHLLSEMQFLQRAYPGASW
ncbi:phenylacetate-CoA oxygenase subunit PaaC [Sphingomonas oligophenolica]|uniref:1,2-phenylacetyl-CoA epoxidase subunit PaaC n=1 Tax=Sphingomonas oligophenolica TaxID=301154 RepID=A0ABU9YB09_9SPHN